MALTKKQRAELRMKFGGVGVSLEINGMPTTLSLSFVLMEICFSVPRASGDKPQTDEKITHTVMCSPRQRG